VALKNDSDGAVLARNYSTRLDEFVDLDEVTHRSGKPWTGAEAAVKKFGKYPIYYVERDGGGMVTHKGYISNMVVNPQEGDPDAEELREHISDTDTYSDYNDELDTTTFLVSEGEELKTPFHQSDLTVISTGNAVSEDLSRQPAYVKQRPGDFADFPDQS